MTGYRDTAYKNARFSNVFGLQARRQKRTVLLPFFAGTPQARHDAQQSRSPQSLSNDGRAAETAHINIMEIFTGNVKCVCIML